MTLLLALAATCLLEESDTWGPDGHVPLRAETVVSERPGRLRLLHEGKLMAAPVLRIETAETSEGGLLGIAVNPKDASQLFLYATVPGPRNELQRWKLSADHTRATR